MSEDCAHNFPAGLIQPDGCCRFGLEALLLGAFAERHINSRHKNAEIIPVAELGCGAGAALFSLLLRVPLARGFGLDAEERLITAAKINALNLGLAERAEFEVGNAGDYKRQLTMCRSAFRLVMANPPWYIIGHGKTSAYAMRQNAKTGDKDTLRQFCRCAFYLLAHHGFFCLIIHTSNFCDLCAVLAQTQFGVREVLPIYPFADKAATRALVLCQKEAKSDMRFLPGLVTHEKKETVRWSDDALHFCSWLKNFGSV